MSLALHAKLFDQFKAITNSARMTISSHIDPILEGGRAKDGDTDAKLADLYEEWKASCRALAAALQCTLPPNEEAFMPKMPVDDEEHQPCRQMAAVLIERNIYDEQTAIIPFQKATQFVLNSPACAHHSSRCACKMVLRGWTYPCNDGQVKLLKDFYEAHYDEEKNADYMDALIEFARKDGITLEEEVARMRILKERWINR